MIAKASHPRSQTHRKTSPAPEAEAEAATEAAPERLLTTREETKSKSSGYVTRACADGLDL